MLKIQPDNTTSIATCAVESQASLRAIKDRAAISRHTRHPVLDTGPSSFINIAILFKNWVQALAGMTIKASIAIALFLTLSHTSFAGEQKVPRFAIVKSNQVNARTGPGSSYSIDWVFVSKGEPIKIIAEFEQWRKVEDVEGKGGWVHSSVLSPKRSVVIISNNIQKLFVNAEESSRVVAKLEPQVRCSLDKCKDHWCKIKCDSYKGWIETKYLWGVLTSEEEEF